MTDPQLPPAQPAPIQPAPAAATSPGATTTQAATATPAAATPMPGSALIGSLSRAEQLIAGGSALVLVTALFFTIFAGYGIGDVPFAAAAVALAAVLLKSRVASLGLNATSVVAAAALVLVVVAARDLLGDLIFIATPPAGLSVERLIGMLGYYIGVGLIAFGAWQLRGRRTA